MKFNHLHALFVPLIAGMLLSGCRSDVNLSNVDTTSEVNLGLALPIGSLGMTLNDLFDIKKMSASLYVDTMDGEGVVIWTDTFSMVKDFHHMANTINKDSLAGGTFDVNLFEQLKDVKYEFPKGSGNYVELVSMSGLFDIEPTIWLPEGYAYTDSMNFEVTFKVNGINNGGENRLDSALIPEANLVANISKQNFDDIKWDWFDKIEFDLPSNFEFRNGQSTHMVLYEKGVTTTISDFGQDISIPLKDFILNMTDENGKAINSCTLSAKIYFTIPDTTAIKLKKEATVSFTHNVNKFDFKAFWGWFVPSSEMADEGRYPFGSSFDSIPILKKAFLPFASPKIQANVKTQVAGAIVMDGKYLLVRDKSGVEHKARFENEDGSITDAFERKFTQEQCVNPNGLANLEDSTNLSVQFDNTPKNGHIDELFDGGIPNELAYSFTFHIDSTTSWGKNIRVLPNTSVSIKSKATIPLTFKPGLSIAYTDTLDINVRQFSIDSLIASVPILDEVKDSTEVTLNLIVDNNVPLQIGGVFLCQNAAGKPVVDSITGDTLKLFPDTLKFNAPTYADALSKTPGHSEISTTLSKRELQLLSSVERVMCTLFITNGSLADAYKNGYRKDAGRLDPSGTLKLRFGLDARICARLNFNNQNNNKK